MPNHTWICSSCGNKNPPLTEVCRDCGVAETPFPVTLGSPSNPVGEISQLNELSVTRPTVSEEHISANQEPSRQITNAATWRCVSCYRVNSAELSACSKCGLLLHPDLGPAHRSAAKLVYFFQAIFMAFGILAVLAVKAGFFASICILLVVWWAGIVVFASHPVGGNFEWERKSVKEFIEVQETKVGRLIVKTGFCVLYWPIFISKDVYLGLLLFGTLIYYALKHF